MRCSGWFWLRRRIGWWGGVSVGALWSVWSADGVVWVHGRAGYRCRHGHSSGKVASSQRAANPVSAGGCDLGSGCGADREDCSASHTQWRGVLWFTNTRSRVDHRLCAGRMLSHRYRRGCDRGNHSERTGVPCCQSASSLTRDDEPVGITVSEDDLAHYSPVSELDTDAPDPRFGQPQNHRGHATAGQPLFTRPTGAW